MKVPHHIAPNVTDDILLLPLIDIPPGRGIGRRHSAVVGAVFGGSGMLYAIADIVNDIALLPPLGAGRLTMRDPEQEQMEERAAALWRRFHFPLILVVLTVLSGIVGFTYTSGNYEQARLSAGEALFGVRAAAEDGDLEKARELYAQMEGGGFASMRHLAAFALAGLLVGEGEADSAAELLVEVSQNDEDEGVRQMAFLRLSEIYINEGRVERAAKLLEDNMPESASMRILFLERIGDAAFAGGDTEGALDAYGKAAEIAERQYPSYLTILRVKISALLSLESN